MSTIKVNAIQHTSSNVNSVTLFANGNVSMTTANTVLLVGNTMISNAGISVGGVGISLYSTGTMKNRIINGDMRIDQRFNGAANNNITGQQYVVDRWMHSGPLGLRFRSQQNNTNGPGQAATQSATGFLNYFGANVISSNATYSAGDAYYYLHGIEGFNTADLNWGTANASPVTLSFWVYSSVAGTHSGCISNGPTNRSYPFTYSINTANNWQFQTITIPGDTTGTWFSNNSTGIYLVYNLGAGSTYTASSGNSWQAGYYQSVSGTAQPLSSANGSFYFTGVQLEKGSAPTAFDFRHYTTELQLCQRYLHVFGALPIGNGETLVAAAYASGSNYFSYRLPVTMRTSPLIAFNTAVGNLAGGGTTPAWTTLTYGSYVNPNTVEFYVNGTTTSGYAYLVRVTSGSCGLSAELAIQN